MYLFIILAFGISFGNVRYVQLFAIDQELQHIGSFEECFGKVLSAMHTLKWHACLGGTGRSLQCVGQDGKSPLGLVASYVIKDCKHKLMQLNKVKEITSKRHHRFVVKEKIKYEE